MKVSVKKISELTGFSQATVSNALNGKRGVNQKTAEIIREAAEKLGYFSESHISKVKFVMYKRDGSVVEDTPYFPSLIAGVEQECRANGMDMTICNLDRRDSDFAEQFRQVQQDNTCGVILLGTELMEEDIYIIQGMNCPYVLIDYWKDDMNLNSIMINNVDSARKATNYLIQNGHREIGYLYGDFRIVPFEMRFAGYRSSLRRNGIPMKEEYLVEVGTTMDTAYQGMLKYLSAKPKLPTAFFADNDMIALGAMKACQDMGIRIPEDLSMVGFDDLTFSSIAATPLTTLRVPKQEMGRYAVMRLLDVINGNGGRNAFAKIQICTDFVERSSVRKMN